MLAGRGAKMPDEESDMDKSWNYGCNKSDLKLVKKTPAGDPPRPAKK